MSRIRWMALMILVGLGSAVADPPNPDSRPELRIQKEALARWNGLIGGWRGTGQPRRGSNTGAWREDLLWAWKFSEKEAALIGTVSKGKLATTLTMTAVDDAGRYAIAWTSPEGVTRQLTGQVVEGKLTVESAADDLGEVYRITLTPLNDLRTLILFEKRKSDQQSYNRLAEVGYTREGARLAGNGGGGPECVVTGGLGTIKVQHAGKSYYVCCTGCQQAFQDDPEGILAEYKARKEKEKSAR